MYFLVYSQHCVNIATLLEYFHHFKNQKYVFCKKCGQKGDGTSVPVGTIASLYNVHRSLLSVTQIFFYFLQSSSKLLWNTFF